MIHAHTHTCPQWHFMACWKRVAGRHGDLKGISGLCFLFAWGKRSISTAFRCVGRTSVTTGRVWASGKCRRPISRAVDVFVAGTEKKGGGGGGMERQQR